MVHTYSISNSQSLFKEAQQFIPGGVNSPVRAFKSVGGDPIFIKRAEGAYIFDQDGNDYVELINSWGPMILGHGHPYVKDALQQAIKDSFSFGAPTEIEVHMAQLIVEAVPSIEVVRMVNSGTEATMSAIRVARGYTGKDKILKFAGHYHGHGDSFLIAAGSGSMTFGIPNSPGVTKGTAQDTLIADFNDLDSVKEIVYANSGQIAAIILEPVTGNMGVILPKPDFLQGLRTLCDEEEIILIFDEVMTGFRLTYQSAQQLLGVIPDMTTLGKIIGGGLPVGAYGGKREIMNYVSPVGPVYQAGTLSGNPLAMHAGFATLSYLRDHPEIYEHIDQITGTMAEGMSNILTEKGVPHQIGIVGSMFTVFFTEQEVNTLSDVQSCSTEQFARFFHSMLKEGVYLPPSQYEAMFISNSINTKEIDRILSATQKSCEALLG